MSESATPLSPRVRRILELAYRIDGVSSAKVWLWDARVAVGLRGRGLSATELIRRAEEILRPLQEPGEIWDFGILEDADYGTP